MKELACRASAFGIAMLASCLPCSCASRKESATKLEPTTLGTLKRVYGLDGIFLADQPSPGDFKAIKEGGVKTVVNLRRKEEVDWDERAVVEALHLEYHSVPFATVTELTDDVFDETRRLLADTSKRPILVHCASVNRVGAVWLVHRVIDDRVPYESALEEARAAGLKTTALEEKAKAYIEKQKP